MNENGPGETRLYENTEAGTRSKLVKFNSDLKKLAPIAGVLLSPCLASAGAGQAAHLDLPLWSVAPFGMLLLTIAILPLVASHWWHSNVNRALVAAGFALPVAAYLIYVQFATG